MKRKESEGAREAHHRIKGGKGREGGKKGERENGKELKGREGSRPAEGAWWLRLERGMTPPIAG